MKKVPTWVWWTLGVAAAGGVGYLILRPSPVAAAPGLPPPDDQIPPTIPAGPGGIEAPVVPGPLPGLDGYTNFFTPESEQLIVGALESWKVEHGVATCNGIEVWDAHAQTMLIDHFEEARAATLSVLDEHYPLEGGQAWQTGAPAQPEWARWLLDRVELMAERLVCGFEPIT